jgi:F0F1-type ATP synthase assembly protein I
MGDANTQWSRQALLATTIPMVLVVGPLLGYVIGAWAEGRWPQLVPWGVGIGTIVGLLAGVRQTYHIIRQIQSEDQP